MSNVCRSAGTKEDVRMGSWKAQLFIRVECGCEERRKEFRRNQGWIWFVSYSITTLHVGDDMCGELK